VSLDEGDSKLGAKIIGGFGETRRTATENRASTKTGTAMV
jgi:hypothetical protein